LFREPRSQQRKSPAARPSLNGKNPKKKGFNSGACDRLTQAQTALR
jgi:hypothetical protein